MRKMLNPVVLTTADGQPLLLPRGTLCVSPESATHRDPAHYVNPDTFDPWRFADLRAEAAEGSGSSATIGLKHQFVSTSVDYVSFGHGKHAW